MATKKPYAVSVEWNDACSYGGWTKDISADPMPVKTVGFLIRRDKKTLTIAQSIGNAYAEQLVIPSAWISKVRRLK